MAAAASELDPTRSACSVSPAEISGPEIVESQGVIAAASQPGGQLSHGTVRVDIFTAKGIAEDRRAGLRAKGRRLVNTEQASLSSSYE